MTAPTATTETPLFVPCPRCGGQGGFECYGHIDNGTCFKCGGAQGYWSTVEREERLARQREQRAARKEAKRAKAEADFLAQHEGLAEALQTDHYIVDDLAATLRDCGSISEKQVALAHKIAKEVAEREAERAAQPKEPVVEGRGPVAGTVVHLRWEDSPYNGSLVGKMLVADDRGFRLWGTVPRSLRDEIEKGQRVGFTATLAAKENGFGFFSRPSKAAILD